MPDRILVTGATGMVGLHLVRSLVRQGRSVTALVREGSDCRHLPEQALRLVGDVLNLGQADAAERFDAVVHTAAAMTFPLRGAAAARSEAVNVQGTANTLDFARRSGARRFVHMSSSSVMGDCFDGERDESHPCAPDGAYGRSKRVAEELVARAGEDLETVVLRPSLVYGAYDRGAFGHLLAAIDRGRFFLLGNGENKKSPVSVHNLVQAVHLALDRAEAAGQTYMVTDGASLTLRDFCGAIAQGVGREHRFRCLPRSLALALGRVGDLAGLLGLDAGVNSLMVCKFMSSNTYSCRKICAELGYSPQSVLHETIAEAVGWYRAI